MTTTPDDPTTALPARSPVVDLATWQSARDELLVRERPTPARTTPSPRPAAGCRWRSSTGRSSVVGPDGPVPFRDHIELAITQNGGGVTATAPANANLAPPGCYILFVLDANNIPSVATWTHVG